MKRKMNLKSFFLKKKVAAGCIAVAAVLAFGSISMVWQSSPDVPELTTYTDPEIETTITGDDTPLASKPKVTTKTTSKTKTTKKKVKMKRAAKKSYTKKLPTKSKTKTNTARKNKTTTVKTQTTEKFTKKSKKKLVTEKITTTVKTTTTVAAAPASQKNDSGEQAVAVSAGSSSPQSKYTVDNVASIAPKMDKRVLEAYTEMGFKVVVDPSVSYSGHFDARTRTITLQEADDTIYHELGHFLAFIAGNADQSSSFASVYNNEKSKFTGYNKAYATQNASEYFAESVRDYVENPDLLSSQRSATYNAIQQALNTVTSSRVNMIMKAYGAIWN